MRWRLITAGVVAGALALAPVPASAFWYDITTDLPAIVTGPTPFTVTVTDGEPCRMTYEGQERTTAPWTFTFTPGQGRRWSAETVDVQLCDGTQDEVWLRATLPFEVYPRLASAEEGPVRVSVSNLTGQPGRIVVRDGKGRAVATGDMTAEEGTATFRSRSRKPVTGYSVEVEGGGYRMSFPLDVMRGWNTYERDASDQSTLGRFPPCSTLTWVYRDKGRPAGTSRTKVLADINGALTRLSKETGVRFVRSTDSSRIGSNHVISIGWEDLGRYGPAGVGGGGTRISNGVSTVTGEVALNTKDSWATSDSAAGFGSSYRWRAGRGWLLVHELMHVLGLQHTEDRDELMASYNSGQRALGKGDLAGLRYLYPKKGCSRE